jgi:hypothetical protein
MKKKTVITTEKREVWIIRRYPDDEIPEQGINANKSELEAPEDSSQSAAIDGGGERVGSAYASGSCLGGRDI